ncbi:MAG: tRNA pseudouridine(38-40) synthase TruA [Clostridia bacterium]
MRNIKLTIEYKGSNYCGWQKQKNGLSIQQAIVTAIAQATGESVALNGSGRTDSGVHAIAQVANFHTASPIPPERFSFAINAYLPEDISIVSSEEVPEAFHARFNAKGKVYRYYIWNAFRRNAIIPEFAYFAPNPLDLSAMQKAAQIFVGKHDFAAFMAVGSKVKSTTREIYKAEVSEVECPFGAEDGSLICIELTGSGFLYNMVRIIAGTLMEVGLGKRSERQIADALEKGERGLAGQTLPPEGLFLYKVLYEVF